MSNEVFDLVLGIMVILVLLASIGFSLYIMYQIGNKLDKDDE